MDEGFTIAEDFPDEAKSLEGFLKNIDKLDIKNIVKDCDGAMFVLAIKRGKETKTFLTSCGFTGTQFICLMELSNLIRKHMVTINKKMADDINKWRNPK